MKVTEEVYGGYDVMCEKNLSRNAMKICTENTLQKVLDILEADDGRSFEEKKQAAIKYLENQEDTLLAEKVLKTAIDDENGKNTKEKFWKVGNIKKSDAHVCIKEVNETDREWFLELQKETCIMKSMLKEECYRIMLWNEHVQDKTMMFTIEVDGEYAGYCGINNLARENWEIAIELKKRFHNKGVGYTAISIMLTEIKSRLGRDMFRVKIDSDNYASQSLFEKLGAVPFGIAECMLHREDDIIRCEEENLDAIDEKLIQLAEKFKVEPRKLLSHVLEYELKW